MRWQSGQPHKSVSSDRRRPRPLAAAVLMVTAASVSAAEPVTVRVLENTADRIVIDYELGQFTSEPVIIDGRQYARITLGKESPLKKVGAPELPNVNRSIIIPDDAKMAVKVLASEHHDITDMDVPPSKGYISRTVDPKNVPYTFGPEYKTDAFYPAELAALRSPHILREHRGLVVEVNPLRYNPVTRTLRVWTKVTVEVVPTEPGVLNVLARRRAERELSLAFHTIYKHHFINYDSQSRYDPLDETGDMLIIAHDSWISNVQPLADHKTARGIDTTVVGVSTIGDDPTAIKDHIQGVYDSSDLAFVLLVGDAAQVPTFTAVSGYDGASDPKYSKLAGEDDYPDIVVGRFSAETPGQVDTQVERTIEYETMPATAQDWFWRGMGVASDQGTGDDGEYDDEHIDNIRDDLLAYGYTEVDQIYDPYGTAQMVTDGLNAGRGIVNYCGHGSTTSWISTGFSNYHIDALVNDNMLPFIVSVACKNGRFDGYTCFAEAWLRATHDGEPTGAIGCYASSINQPWDPPMEGQDEFNLLYVAESYSSYGALCYAGSCSMMDDYPGSGETHGTGPATFNTWHVFGDPSLQVVLPSCTDAGTITLDRSVYRCDGTVAILVNDCGLNTDDGVVDTVTVTVTSDTEPGGESVLLTEITADAAQFTGSIQLSVTDDVGVLQVTEGDTVTASYYDEDDGTGSPALVEDTASVDCTPPEISDVQAIDITPSSAVITFDASEPARGTVYYGLSCASLTETAVGSGYSTSPTVNLIGLQDATTYFYAVEAEDEAGNTASDDDDGNCYIFATPPEVRGDCNGDGVVDLDDHALFSGCISGPEGGIGLQCVCLDLDEDGDVDLADFAVLQRVFGD